jgi:magnesium-transporting ATPase (P-type)
MNQFPSAFWSASVTEMLQNLETSIEGLTSDEAQKRLSFYGSNLLKSKKRSDVFALLISQFKSPLF